MPRQVGFTALTVLIVATIALVCLVGGLYLIQHRPSGQMPSPSASTAPNSDFTSTPQATSMPNPSPGNLIINNVTQPTCTSTSCRGTTTLIIVGGGFAQQTQLSASGQGNGNPYTAILSDLNPDGTQIIFDLHNLPCQSYNATLTNPLGSKNFTFYPKNC